MQTTVKRILWVDNDPAYISPYADVLMDESFEVKIVKSVLQAERLINANTYDLLILDVMIPTFDENEEKVYPPEETDCGHKTGLLFYKRNRELLEENKTKVLVMTVRLDRTIKDEFMEAGLPRDCIATKFALKEPDDFLKKVLSVSP